MFEVVKVGAASWKSVEDVKVRQLRGNMRDGGVWLKGTK